MQIALGRLEEAQNPADGITGSRGLAVIGAHDFLNSVRHWLPWLKHLCQTHSNTDRNGNKGLGDATPLMFAVSGKVALSSVN
jgi:hypothetical protein